MKTDQIDDGTIGVPSKYFELRARQKFTTHGETSGELAAALGAETTTDLQRAYYLCRASGDFANPVFGGNAVRWEWQVGAELIRRGVGSFWICDVFGRRTITVKGGGK